MDIPILLQELTRIDTLVLVPRLVRLGSAVSLVNLMSLDSLLPLQSMSHVGTFLPVCGSHQSGLLMLPKSLQCTESVVLVVQMAHSEVLLLMKGLGCSVGSALLAMGLSRLGPLFFSSVLDFCVVDLFLSVRHFS